MVIHKSTSTHERFIWSLAYQTDHQSGLYVPQKWWPLRQSRFNSTPISVAGRCVSTQIRTQRQDVESDEDIWGGNGFYITNQKEQLGTKYQNARLDHPDSAILGYTERLDFVNSLWSVIDYRVYDDTIVTTYTGGHSYRPNPIDEPEDVHYPSLTAIGEATARFHPPIEDARRHAIEYFLELDLPIAEAISGLIRQQRSITHNLSQSLRYLSRHIHSDATSQDRIPIDAEAASDNLWDAAMAIECAEEDCYPSAIHIADAISLWDAVDAQLLAQEQAGLDQGLLVPLDWQKAIVDAEQASGIEHPAPHHDYDKSSDTELTEFYVSWNGGDKPRIINIDWSTPETVILMQDDNPSRNIRSDITDVMIHTTARDSGALVRVDGTTVRGPINAVVPRNDYETSVTISVLAANHIASREHTITFRRTDRTPSGN